MCRTPKCDGRPKVRWSAPNPDGLTRQSAMVTHHAPKCDGLIRQSAMVLNHALKLAEADKKYIREYMGVRVLSEIFGSPFSSVYPRKIFVRAS